MKGLLSGMSLPCLLAMRKRRRAVSFGSQKRARKLPAQSAESQARSFEIGSDFAQCQEDVELCSGVTELAQESQIVEPIQDAERRILYDGDKATVRLKLKQIIAIDGWAVVRLLEGGATVHGYSLSPGVDVLLCSNSKLAAVVSVEAQGPPTAEDGVNLRKHENDLSPGQSSGMSDEGSGILGCVLEFKSYRGVISDYEARLDDSYHESAQSPTFRLEIPGENDAHLDHANPKRKREEGFAGDPAGQEDFLSDSEEDDEVRDKDRDMEDQIDMEVDELPEEEVDANRKKSLKVSPTPLLTTVIPESWWAAAKSILHQVDGKVHAGQLKGSQGNDSEPTLQAPVVAVCGAKNAGKSTFGRFLLNFLLNSYEAVGYLDTDVGQPEFTVPGCLSLHILKRPVFGSPVLHLQTPERSFFFGDVSPKVDPEMYSRSVGALYDYFKRKYGKLNTTVQNMNGGCLGIPLVINTHGWIKGIGYDVLVDILRYTSPTYVVQCTSTSRDNKNLPAGNFWASSSGSDNTVILYIENALESSNKPSARVKTASDHLRDLRVMAYFRQCFGRSPLPYPYREDKLFAQTALKLVSHPPYQVPLSAVKIWHLHCKVPQSEILYSVNGALVGLGVSSTFARTSKESSVREPPLCVGLGIVRGADGEKGVLYIITPVPLEILKNVDILLQGRVAVPVPLLQAKGYISPYLSHNSVAIEGTGSVAMRSYKKFVKIVG